VAVILIPIVVVVVLALWIVPVMLQGARKPRYRFRGRRPAGPVRGGIFEGDARQQVPHRDDPAAPMPPRQSQ
jgi:hypothetical protein